MPKILPIKSLFANIGLLVLLNLLIKPLWFLMEMLVQDSVGHSDWGMYAAMLSYGFLFIALSDLGINQYMTKSLASQPDQLNQYIPNLLSVKILLFLIYPILMAGGGWLIGYSNRQIYFLVLLCLVHGGTQLMGFFRAYFQAMQRFTIDSILSIFDRALLLLVVVGLFWIGIDIERFVWSRVGIVLLGVLVFYGLMLRFYGWIRLKWKGAEIKKMLRMSLSFAMITVLYSVHDKVDQVMLERLYSELETGLYAGAYRWLDAFSMYLWTILPIFFARFAFFIQKPAEQERLLHTGQVITAIPLIFVSVFVFFYGEYLLFPFENSTEAELATMLACLEALFVAVGINALFAICSTLLTATGYEKPVNIMILLSILINIVLNALFIPDYGAIACAWTTVVSYAFINLCYLVYIHRKLSIQVPFLQTGKLMLAGLVLAIGFYALGLSSLPWYVNTLLLGLAYLVFCRMIGLYSIAKLRNL